MKNLSGAIGLAFVIFFLLVLVRAFNISYPVYVTNTNVSSELSVVGEGKVEAIPDTAYIDVGIVVDNQPTVQAAQEKINETNNKIIESVKNLNVKKEDIKTSNYSINPNYVYEGNVNRVAGYNGNVTITIKVRNPQLASQVVEEATKAGANQIQGTRFVVDDPAKYREQAREKAIANAKDQAEKLTKALGIKLGRVSNVIESSPSFEGIYPMTGGMMKEGMGGGGGPQIEQGSQTITSVVTLYFEKR